MTFNRTLSQLADEYFEQAQVLEGIIAKHRKRLRFLGRLQHVSCLRRIVKGQAQTILVFLHL